MGLGLLGTRLGYLSWRLRRSNSYIRLVSNCPVSNSRETRSLNSADMAASGDTVRTFYDANVHGKLEGFVEGNPRIERAWETIDKWAPTNPGRILEIGCGIGDICWRMTRKWTDSRVIGVDISPKSIEMARKLFGSSRLSFVDGPLRTETFTEKFDFIVLMDVYEHVAVVDRLELHEVLKDICSDHGRIVLSFPTLCHLAWLRQYHPDQIQPVDENISIETIVMLARETGTEVLLYQEVNVWHNGDYAHAVLGRRNWNPAATNTGMPPTGMMEKIQKLLFDKGEPLIPPRPRRLALVHQKLGRQCYPD